MMPIVITSGTNLDGFPMLPDIMGNASSLFHIIFHPVSLAHLFFPLLFVRHNLFHQFQHIHWQVSCSRIYHSFVICPHLVPIKKGNRSLTFGRTIGSIKHRPLHIKELKMSRWIIKIRMHYLELVRRIISPVNGADYCILFSFIGCTIT